MKSILSFVFIFSHKTWLICGQLSESEETVLLQLHNELRAFNAKGLMIDAFDRPQPQAADMIKMTWDRNLALDAQRWADECTGEHDLTAPSLGQGENLAWAGPVSGLVSAPQLLANLYWEIDPRRAPSYFVYDGTPGQLKGSYEMFRADMILPEGMGHYTQLVWSRTSTVGCGMNRACAFHKGAHVMRDYLVCRYAPGGNRLSEPIYKIGAACTQCPITHPFCDQGLCSQFHVNQLLSSDWWCCRWAESGECELNADWMMSECARACEQPFSFCANTSTQNNQVTPSTSSSSSSTNCVDMHFNCGNWALAGECSLNTSYMTVACAKSCDSC